MGEVRLRGWLMPSLGPDTPALLDRALVPFFRAHPNVKITWRFVPWNRAWQELIHAHKRGDPPDVFQLGSTWVGTMAQMGGLLPPPIGIESYAPIASWVNESVTFRGIKMAVPWLSDFSVMAVRTDILDKLGIDPGELTHWPGFLAACEKIGARSKAPGIDSEYPVPIGFSHRPEPGTLHHVTPWLLSGGWRVDLAGAGCTRLLSHPSAKPGIEYVHRLLHSHPFASTVAHMHAYQLRRGFYSDGSLAFLCSHWSSEIRRVFNAEYAQEAKGRHPMMTMRLPRGPAGSIGFGGLSALGVSPASKHAEAAWDLVRFMISDDFHRVWVASCGEPSAHLVSFWTETHGRTDEQIRVLRLLRESVLEGYCYPTHSVWRSIEHTLTEGVSRILLKLLNHDPDDRSVIETANEADARVNAFLRFEWVRGHG